MERARLRYVAPVLLLVLVAGVAFWVTARAKDDCPVATPELDSAESALVTADRLAPAGTVGRQRRPVLRAIDGLGGPFGDVQSGRFYEQDQMPSPLGVGSDLGLATSRSVQVVTIPDGRVRWTREYDAPQAAGGPVGDEFVLLTGGGHPALVSFAADDGSELSCLAAPSAPTPRNAQGSPTLLTDQAGTDVVTLVGPPNGPVTLARVDPGGDVRWQRRLDLDDAGSVTVADGLVVVSRLGHDPVRRAQEAADASSHTALAAYSLADGSEAWTYRPDRGTSASLADWDADSATLLVMESTARPDTPAERTVASLVGLGTNGRTQWRRNVGTGYWDASLWGSAVVAQGADPHGGPQLRAFDAEGAPTWRLRSDQVLPRGPHPRTNFGEAAHIGARFVVPSPNGLLDVDPASGRFDALDSDVAIQEVLPVDDHAVIRTADALLVVGVES